MTSPLASRRSRARGLAVVVVVAAVAAVAAGPVRAAGAIDASTVVTTGHGTHGGVAYTRLEAMFEGTSSHRRPYRVPCQIVAPSIPGSGNGVLLFDWLVASTIPTAAGQEQADARYTLTDEFLFGLGVSYATVRCDPAGIGRSSPVGDPTRPWSDDLLDTSSEHIGSAGDEFDIVVDWVRALRSDPVATGFLGDVDRFAAFGYSASGYRLRGLLRLPMGEGLFDFSLVGGAGNGFARPVGNRISTSGSERPPLAGAGLEIDFQSETDVLVLNAHRTRHEEPNYRAYQFAGASHIRDVDVLEFGLPDAATANPADWVPFFRALFVAGMNWSDGIEPPPSLWLGAPGSPDVTRDTKGNALVTHVGGLPVQTEGHRLPEVAVGERRYIPVDPSHDDGTFLGTLRVLAGSHVDLRDEFGDHDAYVEAITLHARELQAQGYLLEADADVIIERAELSDVGL